MPVTLPVLANVRNTGLLRAPDGQPGAAPSQVGEATVIRTVGVVGAGQMGGGIAQVCATAGLSVLLLDSQAGAVKRALGAMAKGLGRQVAKGTLTEAGQAEVLGRITAATTPEAMAPCDLVIEAATEREEVKHAIFASLLPHLRPEAMLASNTSSISITRLAARTDRPERFIGMHFMNPVPVMRLVEVIRGLATGEDTYRAVVGLAERLGKTVTTSEDFPGFVVNRILLPMLNEACFALHEGVGDVQGIDAAMKLGTNQPMGPFELADFIGLDTCLSILRVLHAGLGDPKYRPCPLLVNYVEAGWVGRKGGRGFYDYSVSPPRVAR